jgi:hypothetical protein
MILNLFNDNNILNKTESVIIEKKYPPVPPKREAYYE